jgi:hypothetical protein
VREGGVDTHGIWGRSWGFRSAIPLAGGTPQGRRGARDDMTGLHGIGNGPRLDSGCRAGHLPAFEQGNSGTGPCRSDMHW